MDENQTKNNSPAFQGKKDPEIHTPLKTSDCNIQYGGISTEDDEVASEGSDSKDQSKFMKLYGVLVTLTIEPVVFCFMFAYIMNLSIMSNMMMDKGCLFHLNYSSDICQNLSNYEDEKKEVEILATNYSLYSNLTSLIAAVLMTFIAPWSDKYGRRIPLLMAVAGAILTDIGIIFCTLYFESRLVYLVISRLPSEFTGGFICMLTIIFSHASEVSSQKNRTLKYTSVEIALGLGIAFGGLTGGFLYRYYGYFYVYATVAVVHVFCFMWALFVVEETTGLDVTKKWHEKARDFFRCGSFKAVVTVTCKPREGNIRAVILLLLLSTCMIVLNYEAVSSVAYVYVHHVYNWDPTTYSIVNTSSSLAGLVITLIVVPILVKVFQFSDFNLGIIGTLSMMGKNLFISFSKHHTYVYYAGLCVGIFSSLSSLCVRTSLSKLVAREELGRVFSFLATCEAVIPMVGTLAVTQISNATLDVFPSIAYLAVSLLLFEPLGTYIWASKSITNSYSALRVTADDNVKEKV